MTSGVDFAIERTVAGEIYGKYIIVGSPCEVRLRAARWAGLCLYRLTVGGGAQVNISGDVRSRLETMLMETYGSHPRPSTSLSPRSSVADMLQRLPTMAALPVHATPTVFDEAVHHVFALMST